MSYAWPRILAWELILALAYSGWLMQFIGSALVSSGDEEIDRLGVLTVFSVETLAAPARPYVFAVGSAVSAVALALALRGIVATYDRMEMLRSEPGSGSTTATFTVGLLYAAGGAVATLAVPTLAAKLLGDGMWELALVGITLGILMLGWWLSYLFDALKAD